MPLQTPQTIIGSQICVDLGKSDSAYISAASTISSSDDAAIYGDGTLQSVTVAGDISGIYGIFFLSIKATIKITPGGIVSGSYAGIQMQGAMNTLFNAGYIDSATIAADITIDDNSFVRVKNTGEMWGKGAIRFTGGSAYLDNYGVIGAWEDDAVVGSAKDDKILNDGKVLGAIATNAGADEISSSGLIRGTVDLGDDGDSLVNRGSIDGTVKLGNGEDVALNRGTITGDLVAGSGDDVVTNRGTIEGNITMEGGFDTFRPGASIEIADGGTAGDGNSGFDALDFSASNGVSVALDDSFDGIGWAAGDTYTGFETVYGSLRKADKIAGTDGSNYLDGQGGADKLYGRGGADSLVGGAGNDLLSGGAGTDSLTGGTGADIFVFAPGDAGGANSSLADVITDFSASSRDKIDLAAIDANTKVKGDQAFALIGQQAFHKTAGELRIDTSDGINTVLQADIDGNGAADWWIVLSGKPAIGADSLLL